LRKKGLTSTLTSGEARDMNGGGSSDAKQQEERGDGNAKNKKMLCGEGIGKMGAKAPNSLDKEREQKKREGEREPKYRTTDGGNPAIWVA